MSKQLDLFSEFMTLGYQGPGENIYKSGLTDIVLDSYIIARLGRDGCRVLFLYNGNKIFIPWKWLDLFSQYNTLYGDQALSLGKEKEKIDKIISLFLNLLVFLDTRRGDLFLDTLYEICDIKTEEFRKWLLSEFGEKLDPITVDSSDSHLVI